MTSFVLPPTSATAPQVYLDFMDELQHDRDAGVPVAAIKALTHVIKRSTASTMLGLTIELRAAADDLKKTADFPLGLNTTISLAAGCELFLRFVTRTVGLL